MRRKNSLRKKAVNETPAKAAIRKEVFVCAPFPLLKDGGLLEEFITRGIQPEIGLEGDCLYNTSVDGFQEIAAALAAHDLACTLHAPFYDLSPGAADRQIATATRDKLARAFALVPVFSPRSIVCHISYEENKHGWDRDGWLDRAAGTFAELIEMAAENDAPVMLENTYETSPEVHRRLLEKLDSHLARFCLDCGHTLAFAKTPWQDWLPELAPWLGQLHLHDNFGDLDAHLGIGQGIFDFPGLFAYLRENNLRPIATIEPHQHKGLDHSLAFLEKDNFFSPGEKP